MFFKERYFLSKLTMAHFSGIITKNPADDLSLEVEKMLSIMSLPKESSDCFLEKKPCAVFGQAGEDFALSTNKQFIIGFHGRIFNLAELKQRLLDHGQVLSGECQTELTVLAYQTWGPEFLEYLDGSFVLFIYDRQQENLLIGRDKIGSHRIYWGHYSNTFIFASQLKGILTSKYVPQHPCLESIASYFYLGYFAQDKTPIANLNCLLPGYYLLVNSQINIVVHKYWSFKTTHLGTQSSTLEEVSENLDHLLLKATEKRNPNNEPMHCLFEGDIGSSSIGYYGKKLRPDATFGYLTDFDKYSSSYQPYVERLTRALEIPLQTQNLGLSQLFCDLSQIVWNLDEPVADPTSGLIWNLAKSLKGKTKTLFTSLGAHEFLGLHPGNISLGYEPLFLWFLEISSPFFLNAGVPLLAKLNKKAAFHALRFFQSDFWAIEYLKQNCFFKKQDLKKIAPALYKRFDFSIYIQQTYQYLKYVHSQNFDVSDYLFYDAETMMSNYLLLQYQNLLESEGITLSCPFLDEEVFKFLMHTPEFLKSRRKKPALPLQKILEKTLREEDLTYNFSRKPNALDGWLGAQETHDLVKILAKGTLCESGIISGKNLLQEYLKGPKGCLGFKNLWSILVLEIWFKLFINRPIYTYPDTGNLALSLRAP